MKFEELYAINVNEKTEEKNKLTYLSWAWAWAEFKKACPDATYEVVKFEDGKPYFYDDNTGYMVYTKVTVDGLTHEMWLPVMDHNNNAMKNRQYKIKTKYKEIDVQPATMFDINKAIMRCLTKNLAMFGLGLYIYAGEDLPESEERVIQESKSDLPPEEQYPELKEEATEQELNTFKELCVEYGLDYKEVWKQTGKVGDKSKAHLGKAQIWVTEHASAIGMN